MKPETLQIVITRNKEAVLSEKDMRCSLGQTCLVGYAEAIDPLKFASFDDFLAAVQKAWDSEWKRVYSANLSGDLQPCPAQWATFHRGRDFAEAAGLAQYSILHHVCPYNVQGKVSYPEAVV